VLPSLDPRAPVTALRSRTITAHSNGLSLMETCRSRKLDSPKASRTASTCRKRSAPSSGAASGVDGFHKMYGGLRLQYFGSRALVEDNSVRSKPTTLVNLQGRYDLARRLRVTADIFNLFNAKDSDIDCFFASRLPGDPLAGVEDIHFHPAVPRTLRVGLVVGF
jgi:hypothetical protein